MEYTEVKISLNPVLPAREVLLYELAELGFDSFTDEAEGLNAYIPSQHLNMQQLEEVFSHIKAQETQLSFEINPIEDKNWNEVWESNFQPITIEDKCIVKAPFHHVDKHYTYEIDINPQMSFGTGHHETTYLMMTELLEMDFKNKYVLDMGSGTGILAILASKLGAKHIDAIDIEEWAYNNALENVSNNATSNISVFLGDAALIEPKKEVYDVVIANINRNILLQDMHHYVASMKANTSLLLSGFYTTDAGALIHHAEALGLKFQHQREKNTWCMLHFRK
jgi:ribosomal protein L11 methyltransferase